MGRPGIRQAQRRWAAHGAGSPVRGPARRARRAARMANDGAMGKLGPEPLAMVSVLVQDEGGLLRAGDRDAHIRPNKKRPMHSGPSGRRPTLQKTATNRSQKQDAAPLTEARLRRLSRRSKTANAQRQGGTNSAGGRPPPPAPEHASRLKTVARPTVARRGVAPAPRAHVALSPGRPARETAQTRAAPAAPPRCPLSRDASVGAHSPKPSPGLRKVG